MSDDSEITTTSTGLQQLELLEKDKNHLLYLIKGGGKNTGGLGCFALIWNLFIGTFAVVLVLSFFNGGMKPGGDKPPLFVFGIISLFVAVGIGMAYAWAYMKYGRTLLMIQPGLIGVQNDLFGWTKMRTLAINPGDTGTFSVSYEQNDVPVYQIEFKNENGRLTFGTGLDSAEQNQLLHEIHSFLGIEEEEPGQIRETVPPKFEGTENEAREVLENARLEIQEEQRGEWMIRIVPLRTTKNPWVGIGCLVCFATFWEGFILFWTLAAVQGSIFFALFSLPFHLVGLALVALVIFLLFGSTVIRFSRSEFSLRWSCFGIGWTSRCPTDQIEEFRIVKRETSTQNRKVRRPGGETVSTALIAQKSGGGEMKIHLGSDDWTPALATFLNHLLTDLRRV